MKKQLTLLAICGTLSVQAQSTVTWSSPMLLSTTVGYNCPRIALSNATPVISWGDNAIGDFYLTRLVSGAFTTPVKVNPTGFLANVNGLNGPEIAASGDTIYASFMDDVSSHIYISSSFNGGTTFNNNVQADNLMGDLPQYPTVGIMSNGNPVIAFAKLTSSFKDPQYVTIKSYNAGINFLPEVNATAGFGADPCDCCPGTSTISGNKVVVIYRNAVNDLRDMRAAISLDTANTFSSIANIDNSGWIIANCPSSAGQGVFNGDTLVSVFMNGAINTNVFISTFNVVTNQSGFQKKIFDLPGIGSQNLPTIAGSNDTIGVAWQQDDINGSTNILFSYSTTGAAGIGTVVDTISDILLGGFHSSPRLAYANGKFYIVFNDFVASQAYYMEATLSGTSVLQEQFSNSLVVYYDIKNAAIKLSCNQNINNPFTVSIHDAKGNLIENFQLQSLQNSTLINLNNKLSSGLYVVTVSNKDFTVNKKIIQH